MKDEILTHLNDPKQLEKMYRTNKAPFKRELSVPYIRSLKATHSLISGMKAELRK
jgi:hypothetical protein